MANFTDRKERKARKPYKCDLCRAHIRKGERYIQDSGRYEGEFYTKRFHKSCDSHISNFLKKYEMQEYTEDYVYEYLFEEYCEECPFLNEEDECDLGKNIFRCDDILQILEDK